MSYQSLVLAALFTFGGCTSETEKRNEAQAAADKAAEEKRKRDEEIDSRAKAIAEQMAKKIEADEEQKRQEAAVAQRAARMAAQDAARQQLTENPAPFFAHADVQMIDKGIINAYRHVTTLTLTNQSKFPVRDIRGKVDFLDGAGEIFATIPLKLTGSLAAGASLVFAEQQGTLSGGTVQLNQQPARSQFSVTSVQIVALSDGATPLKGKEFDEQFRKAMEAAAKKANE